MRLMLALVLGLGCSLGWADSHTLSLKLTGPEGERSVPMSDQASGRPSVTVNLDKGQYRFSFEGGSDSCEDDLGPMEDARARFNNPLPLSTCPEGDYQLRLIRAGQLTFTLSGFEAGEAEVTIGLELKSDTSTSTEFQRPLPDVSCPRWTGEPVTVDVGSVFNDGERVRDYYSGRTAIVSEGRVTLTPATGSNGLLLLEAADHQPGDFRWDNATVYFVMPDRFHNGRTDNDHAFGRRSDEQDEIGTFHGGDLAGLIEKLDYIESLGVDALWMTPVVEQVHGFVAGGERSEFPFYAYHGYWALDYTRLDPNFGTREELRTLVTEARKRSIRLVWDAVINHVGYATLADLVDYDIEVFKAGVEAPADGNAWAPGQGENWSGYHDLIDDDSPNWAKQWWGPNWVRSERPGYEPPGKDDLTQNLAGLPDFRTERTEPVGLPPILEAKTDTRAPDVQQPVADHVIDWQVHWVREFGIPAFRVDTAKHVELDKWRTLKDRASDAYEAWRADNPDQATGDEPFWMVGEVFDHPLYKDYYYDNGFDSLINFSFQDKAPELAQCLTEADDLFARYAEDINTDPDFNGLTYISSHDTTLFYAGYQNLTLQKRVAAPFLLLPGGVQITYGDETARPYGPYGTDVHQGTRSDMNWNQIEGERVELLTHWRKLGQFRNRHNAIGAGEHRRLSEQPYVFSRTTESDRVIVVFAGNEME